MTFAKFDPFVTRKESPCKVCRLVTPFVIDEKSSNKICLECGGVEFILEAEPVREREHTPSFVRKRSQL